MHPELQQKLDNLEFLCHATTPEIGRDIIKKGFIPEGRYATVNRVNDFREYKIIFTIDDIEYLDEDPCITDDTGDVIPCEWNNHDQVIFNTEIDFFLNASLLYVIDEEGNKTNGDDVYE